MNLRIAKAEIGDFLTKIGITDYDIKENTLNNDEAYLAITTQFNYEDLNNANIDLTIICDNNLSISFEFYAVNERNEALELLNTINSTFDVVKGYINDSNNVELVFDYMNVSIDQVEGYLIHSFEFLRLEEFKEYYEELYKLFK